MTAILCLAISVSSISSEIKNCGSRWDFLQTSFVWHLAASKASKDANRWGERSLSAMIINLDNMGFIMVDHVLIKLAGNDRNSVHEVE